MKKKNVTKLMAIILVAALSIVPLGGCGSVESTGTEESNSIVERESVDLGQENAYESNQDDDTGDNLSISDIGESKTELIQFIKTNFVASELPEDYNQPMYNLPSDYVFEFACSEEAGYEAYKAFQVYDNSDYENLGNISYNRNTYEDGKITVAPQGALFLNENGSTYIDDGTWGSLNQLYLVQYIDLTTGEELDRPIVTPFSVEHDLNAPVVNQGIDSQNSFELSWKEVPGAVEYRVYEHFLSQGYKLECTTSETSVTVEDFKTQQDREELINLFRQDLENAGYDSQITGTEGVTFMNSAVRYNEELEDGYFLVVAVDADGKQSGMSNIVNVRDIAARLPYKVAENVVEVEISSVEDIPTYVDVEMVDGSVQQMIIDYHGARAYRFPDDDLKMVIQAGVANTLFNKFLVTLRGMPYDDILADISYVTEREDELLSRISGIQEPEISVDTAPSDETDDTISDFKDEEKAVTPEPTEAPTPEPTEEPSPEPTEEPTPEPTKQPTVSTENMSAPVQLMYEVSEHVQQGVDMLGKDKVNTVLYASNDLGAWMAMCLIMQSQVIPIPVEVFPDAANLDYAVALLMEAYRQNPTSGFLTSIKYSSEYQALVVEYQEEPAVRLAKTEEEINAAQRIAAQVTTDDMSDYEKVLAINEYFRNNASYDFDSTATEIEDYSTLSEQFMDSHSPYGIICNNYGVCESYSEAFVLTARFAGLEAMCEVGTLHGGGHEWNRVKVDGSWCVLDVTNNDIDIFINGLFNVTDEQVAGVLVPNNSAIMNHQNYAATDASKEYYYMNGSAVTDLDDAADMLAEQLEDSDCALIRIPETATKEELEAVLAQLVQEKGVNISKAGEKLSILCVMK